MFDNLSLRARVLLTVSYNAVFSWPLTLEEIQRRLLACHRHSDSDAESEEESFRVITQLLKEGLLIKEGKLITLKTHPHAFKIRQEAELRANKKWVEVRHFVRLVSWLPWLQAIFVTGSLAVNHAKKNDDIDFLLVTKKNRLWLARPIITLLTLLVGKGRLYGFHAENSWCLNMWLEEDCLILPESQRSVYSAYELLQAVCVWDRGGVEERLARENKWVSSVIPSYARDLFRSKKSAKKPPDNHKDPSTKPRLVQYQDDVVFAFLNQLAFQLQLLYMRQHRSRETVGRGYAYFHPRDTRGLVYRRWLGVIRSLG